MSNITLTKTFDLFNFSKVRDFYVEGGEIYAVKYDGEIEKVPFSLLDIYISAYKKYNAWSASHYMSKLKSLLTDEFFKTNYVTILNELDVLPLELIQYDFVFEYLYDNDRYDLIFQSSDFEEKLDKKINGLDENSEKFQKFTECVQKLVDSFGGKIPNKYSSSVYLAYFVLNTGDISLFNNYFSLGTQKRFLDEVFVDYFDKFSELSYVPGYLIESKLYFDYLLEKKNFSLLMRFDKKFITDEFIQEHYESITNLFKKEVVFNESLNDCSLIYDILLKLGKYNEICTKMKLVPRVSDLQDNAEFSDTFLSVFNSEIEKIRFLAKENDLFFKLDKELFDYFLSKGEYQFVLYCFDSSLFTPDVVKKYPDMINGIGKEYKVDFCFSYDVLKYYLEQEDYFLTPVHLFENDTLYEGMVEYPDKMKALILERVRDFSWSYSALSMMIEEKEYATFTEFNKDLWDEELCSDLDESFCDYLVTLSFDDMFYYYDIVPLFEFCVSKKRFDVVLGIFNEDFFTEEFFRTYADEIIEASHGYFSNKIKSDYLFKRAIEKGDYDLAVTYNYITNEHIDIYFNELLSAVGPDSGLNLKNNKYFIDKCISENVPNLLTFIDGSLVTEELLKGREKDILNILENSGDYNILGAPVIFRYVLENGLFSYLTRLKSSALDEDYVIQYLNLLDSNVESVLPDVLHFSKVFLKHCIDNGKSDLLFSFYHGCYDALDDDYFAKLEPFIKLPLDGEIKYCYKLLDYFIRHDKLDYISEFDSVVLGHSDNFYIEVVYSDALEAGKKLITEKLADILYPYFVKNGLPENVKNNVFLLKRLLVGKGYRLIDQFNSNIFDKLDPNMTVNVTEKLMYKVDYVKYLIEYIDEYCDGVVPANIAGCAMLRNEVFKLNRDDLFVQFVLNVKSEDMLKRYARQLGYDYESFKQKIDYLLTRNDELFNTVMPLMFSEKMNVIAFKHLEKIMLYPDLQVRLINMDERYLKFMSKVFDLLDDEKYDYSGVIVSLIENVSKHEKLMATIDLDNITQSEFIRLITVISKKDGVYDIKNVRELKDENYENVRNNIFKIVKDRIKKGNISLQLLKRALLEMKFGLGYSQADFIVQRYCHNLKSLDVSYFDKRLYTILCELDHIVKCDSIEELKYLFINSKNVETDFYTVLSLESTIRGEFAKLYNDTLYKVNKDHKVENSEEVKKNKELYDKLSNLKYKGKEIPVYIMDGNFNLQIHALGAYRLWDRPDNFKTDWERPKIAYHGICTSYIGNNQIANARAKHPILGFDGYESSAILCAGNYDLFSDPAISRYDASMYKPYHFFLPQDMIDNTRHTHNEMVIERRYNKRGSSYKRLPNYVVMIVDDINNMENYDGELWDEYCQAASDYGVPIVIIDRLKYAKLEIKKIEDMVVQFGESYNVSLIDKIIVEFCNNMIGCQHFAGSDKKAYHEIFTAVRFEEIVNTLTSHILSVDDELVRVSLLARLNGALNNEIKKGSKLPALSKFKNVLEMYDMDVVDSKSVNNKDRLNKQTVIHNYYYNASEEVQQLIEKDLKDNVDLDTILSRINQGIYEGGIKI